MKSKENSALEALRGKMISGYPILNICTMDEQRAVRLAVEIANEDEAIVFEHDIVCGLTCRKRDVLGGAPERIVNVLEALDNVLKRQEDEGTKYQRPRVYLLLKDFAEQLGEARTIRRIKNFLEKWRNVLPSVKIIGFSSHISIPDVLSGFVDTWDLPGVDSNSVAEKMADFFSETSSGRVTIDPLAKGLAGMSEHEIDCILGTVRASGRRGDSDGGLAVLKEHHSQSVRKGGLLTFENSESSLDKHFGGGKKLKKWLETKKAVFADLAAAKKAGVDTPKGMLLAGITGCGKSLIAKSVGSFLNIPTLRLDMGKVMGMYLGESEAKIRKALKQAEALAPCVLWIDEVEKAFAGLVGGKGGSNDTGARVFATVLTWLQEKDAPVFVVATANRIETLPPEFSRKGRFDEAFYVDLPNPDEIAEIVKIHVTIRGKSWWKDVQSFAKDLKGYSGADLEALVKIVFERAYHDKKEVTLNSFKEAAGDFVPLEKAMPKAVAEARKMMKKLRFRSIH